MPVQAVHQLHQVQRRDFADFLLRQSPEKFLIRTLHEAMNGLKIAALGDRELIVKGRKKLRILEPFR